MEIILSLTYGAEVTIFTKKPVSDPSSPLIGMRFQQLIFLFKDIFHNSLLFITGHKSVSRVRQMCYSDVTLPQLYGLIMTVLLCPSWVIV